MTDSTTKTFNYAAWPPTLTDAQRAELTRLATTYALAHGLLYLPPHPTDGTPPPFAPKYAIHAPLALLPAPFPRKLVEEAARLQKVYNVLYARVARDVEFLDDVMGAETPAGAGSVDTFTGELWRSWKRIRERYGVEPLHLGIFRSDYLLHAPEGADAGAPLSLKQVEFNTISSSFGALAQRVSDLHKYLLSATGYYGLSPHLTAENLPSNRAGSTVVDGLAAAHRAYGSESAYILFVVQANERNVFDQRWLEYELLEKHGIKVIRQTFDELLTSASVALFSRELVITSPLHSASPIEISVIYFRAGYTPTDYPTPAHYALRERLSVSRAVSCPTLALQLAGGKKVQRALMRPGVLERFLLRGGDAESGDEERFTEEDVAALRATWVAMWGLEDSASELASDSNAFPSNTNTNTPDSAANAEADGIALAYAHSSHLVLKPQREGGGNNVYRDAIPPFLNALPVAERAAWVAMALIEPPQGTGGYLVRAGAGAGGSGGGESGAAKVEVVSELGIFGWALFDPRGRVQQGGAGEKGSEGAFLVRTKGRESDEGGVAVGFSVLDSVLLVD